MTVLIFKGKFWPLSLFSMFYLVYLLNAKVYIPSEKPEYALLADMIISSLEKENKLMKEEPKEDGLVIENAVADPYEVAELYLTRRCFKSNCGIYTTCKGKQINIACVKLSDVLSGSAY